MAGAGHLIGYSLGTFDFGALWGRVFGSAENQQFKAMTVIAASALLLAIGITSHSVTERILLPSSDFSSPNSKPESILSILSLLIHRTLNLPPRIQAICWVQFWSWIGWFPFLFYSTTWVGETYYRYDHPASTTTTDSHDALGNIGRLGSLSLVIFSIITFASSILLPFLVKSPTSSLTDPHHGKFTPRPHPSLPKTLQTFIMSLESLQPDLVTAWLWSNLSFACIMVWAPFVRSLAFATTLVALAGVPWAIASWAPLAEMGVEINRLTSNETSPADRRPPPNVIYPPGSVRGGYSAVRPSMDTDIEMEETNYSHSHSHTRMRTRTLSSDGVLHLIHSNSSDPDSDAHASTGELAGVYLGVLNVYTTLPQFVGTFVSWVVFMLLEPVKNDYNSGKNEHNPEHHKWLDLKRDAPNAVSICLFIGACCAVVAAEATRRLKKLG